jgi:prepilin signal peptidase PulO-like enzyme (type II secretory pathway)
VTGLLFLALFINYPFIETSIDNALLSGPIFASFLFYTVISVLYVGIFFYDLKTKTIPDVLLFPLMVISFIGAIFFSGESIFSLLMAALIAIIFFGGQFLLSKGKWLGEGDVYLGIAIGAALGWKLFLLSTVLSYFIGALVSLPILLSKKAGLKTQVPFAPFMVTGSLLTIFFGNDLLKWYLSTLLI